MHVTHFTPKSAGACRRGGKALALPRRAYEGSKLQTHPKICATAAGISWRESKDPPSIWTSTEGAKIQFKTETILRQFTTKSGAVSHPAILRKYATRLLNFD